MLCDRCGLREASGMSATSWAAADGTSGDYPEQHLCIQCFDDPAFRAMMPEP
jgi:hypothetical protein